MYGSCIFLSEAVGQSGLLTGMNKNTHRIICRKEEDRAD
jgi:hypothetical protein